MWEAEGLILVKLKTLNSFIPRPQSSLCQQSLKQYPLITIEILLLNKVGIDVFPKKGDQIFPMKRKVIVLKKGYHLFSQN